LRPRPLLPLALTLALLSGSGLLAACGGGSGQQAQSPTPVVTTSGHGSISSPLPTRVLPSDIPPCKFPAKIGNPSWFPADLPKPAGMYATQVYPDSFGYSRAIFFVPGSLVDLAKFVLTEWPRAGWVLGRGDSEQSEIEDEFSKPPAVGAFKAQSQFCSPGYNLLLLIYAPDRSKIGPGVPNSQGGSPLVPSPSPSH